MSPCSLAPLYTGNVLNHEAPFFSVSITPSCPHSLFNHPGFHGPPLYSFPYKESHLSGLSCSLGKTLAWSSPTCSLFHIYPEKQKGWHKYTMPRSWVTISNYNPEFQEDLFFSILQSHSIQVLSLSYSPRWLYAPFCSLFPFPPASLGADDFASYSLRKRSQGLGS